MVLPAPCRPAIMITVGIFDDLFNGTAFSPIIAVNWSLTILTTCSEGFKPSRTLAPRALSLTCLMKFLAVFKLTSASSKAKRISRKVSSRSVSETLPFPDKVFIAVWILDVRFSNAIIFLPNQLIYVTIFDQIQFLTDLQFFFVQDNFLLNAV
ncbi:protein of unknown function [Oenococcus oeni]|nr:protein of unknown function [Oenococcus oeni]